jgi:two-component system, OmpR family, phosphate regulon sensor histidine kinase PhoR
MAIDAPSSSPAAQPWSDRLRHSTIILIAAALALSVVVALGELSVMRAGAVFLCIAAAALIPWRLHDTAASRDETRRVNPVESAAVAAVVAGMPDPAVLLDRAGTNSPSSRCARPRSSPRCASRSRPPSRGARPISTMFRSIAGWS